MAPSASPSLLSDPSRLNSRKKRKRDTDLYSKKHSNNNKHHHDDDDDDDNNNDDDDNNNDDEPNNVHPDDDDRDIPHSDPLLDLRETEVLSDAGHKLFDFPLVVRRSVNRLHRSIIGIVAAERCPSNAPKVRPCIENISHGQLQVLSAVLPDHPALCSSADIDKLPAYMCTPPPLLEGKGVVKLFGTDRVLVVPAHSDWFNPDTVHRLERQVVPHFFSGKSKNHTPERYMTLRNAVVAKYIENPARRLLFGECQNFVSGNDLFDLNRIIRFLDHWGIINYLAESGQPESRVNTPLIHEDANGELQVVTAPLKLIDSLMQFDRPRSSYRTEDIASLQSSTLRNTVAESPDLDGRIRERISEHTCSYCSKPLIGMHYQSQKETDTVLCNDCFHDAKFIMGHSSLDFMQTDLRKDFYDVDGGDSWNDQETFLLLEAVEKFPDSWNEIADHVGTKSKAQCILHFIRLPMEEDLLENLDFPPIDIAADAPKANDNETVDAYLDSNHAGNHEEDNSESRLPFSSAANPVMALVAFLATAIGPRVAATCANAALTLLTKDDDKSDMANSSARCTETDSAQDDQSHGQNKGMTTQSQRLNGKSDSGAGSLSAEKVKVSALFGLSAAAVKAKLFADQEEREIQRLTATIINYQLKRLELKLKQFAELETLLLKECDQVERSRQSILAERSRLLSIRFSQVGQGSPSGAAPMPTGPPSMSVSMPAQAATINPNIRQTGTSLGGQMNSPSMGTQPNLPSVFGNNVPTHPHMPFMPRQPMFPFVGPRLPLSAIHPQSSPQASNVMLSSGMSSMPAANRHPLLRSLSSNNNNNNGMG